MPPPDTDLAARVRAGMAFLDQRLDAGWEEAIDPDRLNFFSRSNDILGQLEAAGRFHASSAVGAELRQIVRWPGWAADYAALLTEWRAQLAARRAGKETALKE